MAIKSKKDDSNKENHLVSKEELRDYNRRLFQLETFVKFSPSAIAMMDVDMRYILVNDGWKEAYELVGQNLIGKLHYDIFPQLQNMPDWLNRYKRSLAGEKLSGDNDSFEHKGDDLRINWKCEPWYEWDNSVGGIMLFTEILTPDILDQKRRKEHDNVLRTLLNELEDGFAHARIVRNKNGKPIDWQYLNVGRGLERYVPVPPETLVGKKVSDAIPGAIEADPKWLEIFNEVATTGKPKEIEEYSVILDRWFRMNIYSPAKDEFATIFRDTTEKNKNNFQIKKLNNLFEEVSRIGRIGAWEVDIKTQKCYWSDVVYEIHEEDPSKEIYVEDGFKYYHPDFRKIIQNAVSKAIEKNESYDIELKLITAKGNEIWTRAIGKSHVKEGEVVKLQGLFQDIDLKKRYELEIERYQNELESMVDERTMELQKSNKELEAFSYSISHDLRAPLRAINGYSEALKEDFNKNLTEEANEFLERIVANSEKMGVLIDNLLDFSRLNRRKVEHSMIDLESMTAQLIQDVFPEAKSIIELRPLPTIIGDPELITQVFTNLLSNSVKYSAKESAPKITISSWKEKDSYVIAFEDNGVGFNMAFYNKIFKVFERLHTDDEFEGTGIGLALCQKIMKAHDGEIWAKAELDKGAVFYLRFNRR